MKILKESSGRSNNSAIKRINRFFHLKFMGKMFKTDNWVRPRRSVCTKLNSTEYIKGSNGLPIFKLGENDFVVPVPSR